jgi:acyl-CoA synthetase (AMP-forming)/AMP-acid ligase II
MATLFEHFLTASMKNVVRPAYHYLGKDTNYGELRTGIAKLSYLYQHELGPEPRVVLLGHNSPAWIKTFFALTNIRAVVIPIDPSLPQSDWVQIIKETEPTHVAITSDLALPVRELFSAERIMVPTFEIDKKQGGEYDSSFTAPAENKPKETDLILFLRSGGRTGKPKHVVLSHKQIVAAQASIKGSYRVLSTDRLLTTLSWAHPFALVHGLLFPLMTGMAIVIDPGLQALEFLDFLVSARVTRLVGIPPFYNKLIQVCRVEKRPIFGIKSVTVGLGQLSHEMRRVFQIMKIPTLHVYGMTENVWTISMESVPEKIEEMNVEPEFHGKGLPGFKYKVLDSNGDQIEGEDRRVGSLAVMTPSVMQGYYGKAHEGDTKSALRGTWLYTGDYVALEGANESLRLNFIGRKEDLLKTESELLSLESVDKVLRKIESVQDAAAFVSKDAKNRSVVVCAVVKNPGSALNEKQIIDACKQSISPELQPMAVAFTDFIPRDTAGNINHHKLRALFSGIVS